ncbi:hypothetical protein ACOBR2_09240 [Telmatobacter bradus]|uniref:hypothetical protein n=1 Tax=Telmatobacter bradus TaxID=474953 RepID=UPI003B4348BC
MKFRMRWIAVWVLALGLLPAVAHAVSCVSSAELSAADHASLSAAASRLTQAVFNQDNTTLQAALLPAEADAWTGIHTAVEQSGDLLKNGHPKLRSLYLLDATSLTAAADTQFFCSNQSGSITVTMNMQALPPGRYAVLLADAEGAPLAGQLSMILAWDGSAWKLGGLSLRQGSFDGHDGVWYWSRSRSLAAVDGWSAWYLYEAARYLLLPVDFLSSPNLDKLHQEQAQIPNGPQAAFPYAIQDGERIWKIDSVLFDGTLRQPDLAVVYESTGVTDPSVQRTEAQTVLSAFLKAQPGLRQNFHGLWAIASTKGKQTPIMALEMKQIP